MKIGEWIGENKGAIVFTIAVMVTGTVAYFALGMNIPQ
jgi:hypothetical protein